MMYTVKDCDIFFDNDKLFSVPSEKEAKHLCKQLNSGSGFNLHVPNFFFTSFKKEKRV